MLRNDQRCRSLWYSVLSSVRLQRLKQTNGSARCGGPIQTRFCLFVAGWCVLGLGGLVPLNRRLLDLPPTDPDGKLLVALELGTKRAWIRSDDKNEPWLMSRDIFLFPVISIGIFAAFDRVLRSVIISYIEEWGGDKKYHCNHQQDS